MATLTGIRRPTDEVGSRQYNPRDLAHAGGPGLVARAWGLPLGAHAALLLVLLIAAAVWIGTGASFTSDEGASVLQAHAIEHGSWTVPDPMPGIDPGGLHYPIALSAHGTRGYAPLGKHLFYGAVLAVVDRVSGVTGMVGLSVLGTVAAALMAAFLSRRSRPGLERATLWFVGLGTPLVFDGFLLVGQAVAAAAVVASALLALRFLERGDRASLSGVVITCGTACLLRTEAVLWCVGLAIGAATARSRLAHRRRAIWLGGMVMAAAVGSHGIDVLLTRYALGGSQTMLSDGPAGGHSLGSQVHAAFVSWFQAEADPYSLLGAAIICALAVVALGCRLLKRGRLGSTGALLVGLTIAGLWTVRLAVSPDDAISGLAVAAPLLWAGLWLLDRHFLAGTAGRICLIGSAVFGGLVLVTQYPDGGGLQWGGRFFAIALPVVCPFALEAVRRIRPALRVRAAAGLTATGILVTAVTTVGALGTLRTDHRQIGTLAEAIGAAAPADPGDGRRPVVITSDVGLPRLEWQTFDRVRWQVVPVTDMAAVGRELRGHGISSFLLVTHDPAFETAVLSGSYRPARADGPPVAGSYLVPLRAK